VVFLAAFCGGFSTQKNGGLGTHFLPKMAEQEQNQQQQKGGKEERKMENAKETHKKHTQHKKKKQKYRPWTTTERFMTDLRGGRPGRELAQMSRQSGTLFSPKSLLEKRTLFSVRRGRAPSLVAQNGGAGDTAEVGSGEIPLPHWEVFGQAAAVVKPPPSLARKQKSPDEDTLTSTPSSLLPSFDNVCETRSWAETELPRRIPDSELARTRVVEPLLRFIWGKSFEIVSERPVAKQPQKNHLAHIRLAGREYMLKVFPEESDAALAAAMQRYVVSMGHSQVVAAGCICFNAQWTVRFQIAPLGFQLKNFLTREATSTGEWVDAAAEALRIDSLMRRLGSPLWDDVVNNLVV
jgi:hypothetical protein